MKIELPFPLPTWNRLLAMSPWERKKCRDLIHRMTSMCIVSGENPEILMECQLKPQLMEWLRLEYLAMIRPPGSKVSNLPKKNASRAKKKER